MIKGDILRKGPFPISAVYSWKGDISPRLRKITIVGSEPLGIGFLNDGGYGCRLKGGGMLWELDVACKYDLI